MCKAYLLTFANLTAAFCLQVVMTANAFVFAYIAMPHNPQEHAVAMRVYFYLLQQILCPAPQSHAVVCWHPLRTAAICVAVLHEY